MNKTIEQLPALELVKKVPDASVDIVLTDPPFLVRSNAYKQIRYGKSVVKNVLPTIPTVEKHYLIDVFSECMKKLKKTGWLMFKSDDYTARELYMTIRDATYMFTVIWDKMNISLGYYNRKEHEIIEVYRPKNAVNSYYKYRPSSNGSNTQKTKAVPSIIKVPKYNLGSFVYYHREEKDIHINQTPPMLWRILLDGYCPMDGTILDPFCGTCSVLKAAEELGYTGHYYGGDIELSKYLSP